MRYRYLIKGRQHLHDKPVSLSGTRQVSIILPTYNEEPIIRRLVAEIRKNLNDVDYEIIIVDDDSKDKTPEIIDSLARSDDVIAVHRYGIKGVFSAQYDGVRICRGKVIVFMDADLSHPPKKIPDMLRYTDDYDIVNASRYVKGGGEKAPFLRKYGSYLLNKVCRLLSGIKTKDITGVFHAMKKERFLSLKFQYPSLWGDFDIELFYRAEKKGYKIKEVPFLYTYRQAGNSKSFNLLKIAYVYMKKSLRLRFHD